MLTGSQEVARDSRREQRVSVHYSWEGGAARTVVNVVMERENLTFRHDEREEEIV